MRMIPQSIIRTAKSNIVYELMYQYVNERKIDPERLLKVIDSQDLPVEKKKEYDSYMQM